MPTLISAANAGGNGQIFYNLVGTENWQGMIDFYVDLGAIQFPDQIFERYDGYQLNLMNLYLEQELIDEGDTSLICLVAKEACNCCICAGLTYTDDDEIVVDARYYNADDFEDFVDGNVLEASLNAIDLSEDWIAVNIDADYKDSEGKNVDITGAVGDGFHVWRF